MQKSNPAQPKSTQVHRRRKKKYQRKKKEKKNPKLYNLNANFYYI